MKNLTEKTNQNNCSDRKCPEAFIFGSFVNGILVGSTAGTVSKILFGEDMPRKSMEESIKNYLSDDFRHIEEKQQICQDVDNYYILGKTIGQISIGLGLLSFGIQTAYNYFN